MDLPESFVVDCLRRVEPFFDVVLLPLGKEAQLSTLDPAVFLTVDAKALSAFFCRDSFLG